MCLALNDKKLIELEIRRWKFSPRRKHQIEGIRYYQGQHDILKRQRTVIGKDGELVKVNNLPNNKIVNNQYAKMVDQKINYLLGQPLTFDTTDQKYQELLQIILNKKFHRTLKRIGEDALNCGIAWLYPYYNADGDFDFKRFDPYEILPFFEDSDHTDLKFAVRVYPITYYDGDIPKTIEKVEIYYPDRVEKYQLSDDGILIPDSENFSADYMILRGDSGEVDGYNWGRVPLIPFKYNAQEIPLILKVKSLQDGINSMLSDFQNNMEEDSRNTILVIKNYDGQNLAEFRHNLATYGVVKVKSIDGTDGGVDTLQVQVNAENYKVVLEVLKKSLIENAMGYDAKDDRLAGNPNQMNIQSMYSDIDLNANGMETEFQASFEQLLWFLNTHLANTGKGNFFDTDLNIIFNRDLLMNEAEIIQNCKDSVGIISDETIIGQHPWITDTKLEINRKTKESKENFDEYAGTFGGDNSENPTPKR